MADLANHAASPALHAQAMLAKLVKELAANGREADKLRQSLNRIEKELVRLDARGAQIQAALDVAVSHLEPIMQAPSEPSLSARGSQRVAGTPLPGTGRAARDGTTIKPQPLRKRIKALLDEHPEATWSLPDIYDAFLAKADGLEADARMSYIRSTLSQLVRNEEIYRPETGRYQSRLEMTT
ncbi:hypothetical protein ACQP2E_19045 [Actinoplanes sp. CA-015351]|uniref:hypothetical protein n=1 Tax=Actinoplanes sp. CA-015351 TaxID=3239897 RepID=UPI003D95CBD7